ncbi:BRO-N domain-containing protein [Oleidesulfovibrio alaskensis]|jgi:prophage antirepressor-like protein
MGEISTLTLNGMADARTIVDENGELWFVAMDVCKHLGLKPRDSVRYLDDDMKKHLPRTALGMKPGKPLLIINEPGLYTLIFQSRKPEAMAFQDWVCEEVLPSIRKHGAYFMMNPTDTDESIIQKAKQIIALAREDDGIECPDILRELADKLEAALQGQFMPIFTTSTCKAYSNDTSDLGPIIDV